MEGPRGPLVELTIGSERLSFWWGQPDQIGTAAFWCMLTTTSVARSPRLGESIVEEVAACLLGGFGIPAEAAYAAFVRLRALGLLEDGGVSVPDRIEEALRSPLWLQGRNRPILYRYPRQRAHRIASALRILADEDCFSTGTELRDWLVRIPGVGPKTASWISRNVSDGTDIAVVDIHVRRAGTAAGFFQSHWTLPRDYEYFELAFAAVARLAGVSTTALDQTIWGSMRQIGLDTFRHMGPLVATEHSRSS
jgi:N-glycosylase/DNA lyase